MAGSRTRRERLEQLLPDPQGAALGLVPAVTTYVDPNTGVTQYTYTLTPVSPGFGQTPIQFQYNGSNLGTSGTVDDYNVVSSWATFSRAGNTVTLTIPTPITSPLTTKGDVWGFSTVDARIPVGTNGQVLTADSTQALGVKWGTPSSGGIIQLDLQADTQSTKFGSSTKLTLGRHFFDPAAAQWGLSVTSTATFYALIETTNGTNTAAIELYRETGTGSPVVVGTPSPSNSTTAVLVSAVVSTAFRPSANAGIFAARLWTGTPNGNDEATCSAAWIEITP